MEEPTLTMMDRCDQCGAQAFVKANFSSGYLLFCGHHWNQHKDTITPKTSEVIDETYRLHKDGAPKEVPTDEYLITESEH